MVKSRDVGVFGERLAERHLIRLGYTILDRNYRHGHKEVDLVVRRGAVVAFVEVKTRTADGYGHPLEAITAPKRREIERVARYWRRSHRSPGVSYRFDAVAVMVRRGARPVIQHIPNAWRLGE